ncbi:MAG: DUF6049 family protein [Actinomycetota bacterium]|nr:DUF6049 family protein [Actinomycetota bacterium]MEE3353237.1 DUF6049 family protein [Actinomycetota bacterium]
MADSGSASLGLIAQSPWIDNAGDLAIQLRITGDAHNTVLRLSLHPAVDRRGLLALRDDPILKIPDSTLSIDVDDVINSAGVASLTLPVGPDGILRSRPGEVSPLTVELLADDGRSLDRLTTPVVHLPLIPTGEAAAHRPLLVTLSLNIDGPPPLHPDGRIEPDEATVRYLSAVVDAVLDHPRVPVDISLPPATVAGLAHSDDLIHARLLADLEAAVQMGGLHLRSSPFVTADPEAWRRAGRPDVHRDLMDHGDQVLTELLGTTPDRTVAVLGSTAVPATLDLLGRLGAIGHVVSAERLDPRPITASYGSTYPARLLDSSGVAHPALVADPDLARHLVDPRGSVSATQQLVADLALLAWSDPTVTRTAIVTMPEALVVDALTLDLVLGAVEDAPFLHLRSLPDLFDASLTTEAAAAVTYELWPEPVTPVSRRATDRSLAETAVAAYTAILGGPHPDAAALNDLLEMTAAAELDGDAMDAYLSTVYDTVSGVLDEFTTPTSQSVRLTARRADLPFTIHNGLDTDARVVLVLQSDGRLDFPAGDVIEAVLVPGRNRIAVPVQARTSGDARLQVTVRSPDDARLLQLQSVQLMVRTTSLPGVGVALFVGALAVLAIWWIRLARVRSVHN